jgi:uncharacterized membrane protein
MSIAITLHVLSAVIWVGGMFFAYMALRPAAAALLEPPLRTTLWRDTFNRFFPWVWVAVVLLLVTGYWMIFAKFGGMGTSPLYVHVMNGLGLVMMAIYLHVFFAPFRRMKQAISAQDWPEAGRRLGQIRMLVGINLIIGLVVIAVASGGMYLVL